MKIAFSGHRNKTVDVSQLDKINEDYPYCIWVHGGANGFDTQVEMYARKHNIKTIVIRPDYLKHGKYAPLIRNKKIINMCDLLVACYDGRNCGGTYQTIKYAKTKNTRVLIIKPQETLP
jgi:hypothetical protein